MSRIGELEKSLRSNKPARLAPITRIEQVKVDPSEIEAKVFSIFDRLGHTISQRMPIYGLEGQIDNSKLVNPESLNLAQPPKIRLIKYRHAHNFRPNVKLSPKISPNPTPFEEIYQKEKFLPEDVAQFTFTGQPAYDQGVIDPEHTNLRVEGHAWGDIPQELSQKNGLQLHSFSDADTGRKRTKFTIVIPDTSSPDQVEKLTDQVEDNCVALTPLIFGYQKFWTDETDIEINLAGEIEPPHTIADSIHTTRQLKRAA